VFEHLKDNSLLVVTEDQRLVPGRALEHIRLAEILAAVRGREVPGKAERRASVGPVQDVVDGVESAIAKELGNRSLRELLDVEDGEQEGTLRRRRG
jgi:DNA-binding IscR family transcriptional regulator